MLRNILFFLLRVIVNLVLGFVAWYIYVAIVEPISVQTITPDHFKEILSIVLLLIFLPLFSMKQMGPIRWFSFGISFLLVSLVLLGVFYLNQSVIIDSYTRRYPIEHTQEQQGGILFEAYIYEKSSRVPFIYPNDPCVEFDTATIKMNRGLFGLTVVSNDLSLSKKPGCN